MRINVVQAVIGAALLLFTLTACEEAITPAPTEEPRRVVTLLTDEHQVKTETDSPDSPHVAHVESGVTPASASTTPFTTTWTVSATLEAYTIYIYQVELSRAGTLTARTTGSSGPDTYGYIKDPGGTTLAEDDNGGGGNNFMVTAQVGVGSYHLWVKGASPDVTGRYVLRVDFTAGATSPPDDGDDHGDTRSTATSVATPSSTAGELTARDVDYFAVVVRRSGTLTAYTTGATDTYGRLEDAGGRILDRNDDGNWVNFHVSASVSPGTYYVRVHGYRYAGGSADTGSYALTVSLAAVRTSDLTNRYRGYGDEVFHLNPDGAPLADTRYTLELGNASAQVYLISTNTSPRAGESSIERPDAGRSAAVHGDVDDGVRQPSDTRVWRPEVSEFNNNPPLAAVSSGMSSRKSQALRRSPARTGDRHDFYDIDDGNLVTIPATARRVVSDGTRTLTVWVADADWGARCPRTRCVEQAMVNVIADRFLRPGSRNDIHDWIVAIFGEPWGPHRRDDMIPAEAASEVDILIFDIGSDGAEGGVVGFFWGKDAYIRAPSSRLPQRASNERIMFYLDSYLLANPTGVLGVLIGTLAHEFQHVIHFYQKPILRDARSEAWLNEMASEVAEDFVADKLSIPGPRGVLDDPSAGASGNSRGRLPWYNYFNDIQVTAWRGYLSNYAINYALGAYLARTYGGAALFGDIVRSDRGGIDAIEAALRNQGHSVTFADVLMNWAAANLLSDNTSAPFPYRYNTGTWSTSRAGGVTYHLGSINLYNYRFQGRTGPYLYGFNQFENGVSQPGHSNAYTTMGRSTGTVRLKVNADAGSRITVVVKE